MSWDNQRGVVITKHKIEGTVTVHPKGLLPDQQYEVGFHESPTVMRRLGSELMLSGIKLDHPAPGELIYLNLPDHPGNRIDKLPPSTPGQVEWSAARHMGVRGVEVTWAPANDDHWLSLLRSPTRQQAHRSRGERLLLFRSFRGCRSGGSL